MSPAAHLAQELLPVDLSGGVGLQLDVGCGRQELLGVVPALQLMIGPFNPVAAKLG